MHDEGSGRPRQICTSWATHSSSGHMSASPFDRSTSLLKKKRTITSPRRHNMLNKEPPDGRKIHPDCSTCIPFHPFNEPLPMMPRCNSSFDPRSSPSTSIVTIPKYGCDHFQTLWILQASKIGSLGFRNMQLLTALELVSSDIRCGPPGSFSEINSTWGPW
ncbi:uncharacterized protein BO80DRAFT_427868 [Aspergillus ibericus CBS 121593]|uniref:Uncharacterized protein n=1 Tax=Aspergillus ibericus CBS 121593 TaxID=1448316 RepID=A0A395GSY5_9EURO|nr:hypothetical protein BO80DRAFT_427868 [Aspergillus ibericus CBS 121593]RAK97807.1 hypothetical protein BO80DRAFT_427868 [Aspergillus ibericus CBS 121593]